MTNQVAADAADRKRSHWQPDADTRAALRDHALAAGSAATVLCAVATWRIGPGLLLPPVLALTVLGCLLAAVDHALHRLPDPITFPGTLAVAALLIPAAIRDPQAGLRAVVSAVATVACYLIFAILGNAGLGDVKASAAAGLVTGWIGWSATLAATVVTFLAFTAVGITLIVAGRARGNTRMPLGGYIYGGALLVVLLSGTAS
jgi:leader peptidase (prepilin peptidase)/N-methyltransferase